MNSFTPKNAVRSHMLRLNDQPEVVFELFDPIGERKWDEEWNPNMVSQASMIGQGTVFTTENKEGSDTIWLITEFDKEKHKIAYAAVTPTIRATLIEISCNPEANHTKSRVTYNVTALSEGGNRYVNSFSEEYYREWMMNWEMAINHYIQHGSSMKHHKH